jgi:hypothetical protein
MRRRLAVALSVLATVVAAEPRLELSAHVVVEDAPAEFGGLSGLIVAQGGKQAQVLSDRGKLFDVSLLRDGDGQLTRVAVLRTKFLYIFETRHKIDSEGLARAPDGGVFVSSESPAAVLHYPAQRSWPDRKWPTPFQGNQASNRGLEALAIDPEGRLVTIPELRPDGEDAFPILRLEGNAWQRIGRLEASDSFSVVGADFGPDGRLYVLERAVSVLGFQSRVRRLTLGEDRVSVETLYRSPLGRFDNLEGVSIWQDASSELRLLLVSDNNFLSLQRTEFVELILRE